MARDHKIVVSEQELRQKMTESLSYLRMVPGLSENKELRERFLHEVRMNSFIDLLTEKVKNHLLRNIATVES